MDLADQAFSRLLPELLGSILPAGNPKRFFEHNFMCCLCTIVLKIGNKFSENDVSVHESHSRAAI